MGFDKKGINKSMFCKCSVLGKTFPALIFLVFFLLESVQISNLASQVNGGIRGAVRSVDSSREIYGVNVWVQEVKMRTTTNRSGAYSIKQLPAGNYVLIFSAIGYEDTEVTNIVVTAGEFTEMNVTLKQKVIPLADVLVIGASKKVEKITRAPAAVSKINPAKLMQYSVTGQLPGIFSTEPGIDVVQNGINDFNVNARGFNTTLNRRMLVLQDNRETAMAFLLAQEWNTFSLPLQDMGDIEIIRGPGSALYGANAFSGVINITTPNPKKINGTKATVGLGELNTIRGDVRHAGFAGQWSYKFNVGSYGSNSWTQSRNQSIEKIASREYNGLPREYADVKDGLNTSYANLRIDYNLLNGNITTFEGGISEAQNQIFVTGIGRVQIDDVIRPWGRVNYSSERYFVQADINGRKTLDGHQTNLSSLSVFEEDSYDFKLQFQNNYYMLENQIWFIWGGSHKVQHVDTKLTLTPDTYTENQSGFFTQIEYKLEPNLNFVGAARVDRSTLHPTQFSPKFGVVYHYNKNNIFRITFNKAFQTPNYAEYFLQTTAGAGEDFAGLEQEIEVQVELEENLPRGTIDLPLNFGFTPALARGNDDLDVEKVTGYEIGYKGIINDNFLLTADLYYNRLTNFVTDLLPGINPAYPNYEIPDEISSSRRVIVERFMDENISPGFTTLPDGSHALVVSYANAGEVDEWGFEFSATYRFLSNAFISGNYSFFDFKVNDNALGDMLEPNTPKHKLNLGLNYKNAEGLDLNINLRYVDKFEWASGVFQGQVPSYVTLNCATGYKIDTDIRLGLTVTNLLNNEHYELFGGSINGRRALAAITFDF